MAVDWLPLLGHQFACQDPVACAAGLQETHQVQGSGRGLNIVDVQDRDQLLFICIAYSTMMFW